MEISLVVLVVAVFILGIFAIKWTRAKKNSPTIGDSTGSRTSEDEEVKRHNELPKIDRL